ncbi:UMP-CMP kinase 3 isoform X3 [Physcomitrium patens]|uniref:UMP-CMP kinase n=3 Tax=Physcomitrium patens TaxID=3218 RepID=A0A2K1IS99_PHYPA|nr:UMP-CMP kinase 3-like isoform X1 [Physcomitrium patens]XP_024359996.1 UMP-CMP kinase 3-like isoform X1 [Physcomitrium patens]XP_024359997.1 UMP-CMP kinase 3-like isoform X1 [Physcomitrium patens]XP_024359998.1 UMP-CMP kinase 3-like isoform X1 [Physcomitrium patens]XP_024359999.1 UMP-CMP kinase 3-like isoform X1 [Physcomitrium patens]PNR32144.1 hypothetical protein PHYPA_026269 [Physcomitrium patens]|eukprot:XP_024359995.1 UMP-CMP kinase 3-like isoform X1 [Physcomitrella patens]
MAWAVRSLRRLQSGAVSSHALRLLESRSWIGNSGNAGICADQNFVAKQNSLQTFWVISGASLRTLSTVTVDESAASTSHAKVPQKPQLSKEESGDGTFSLASKGTPRVVFILGGPGSGKGTQCQKIVDKFGFVHLSAGDLLRAEIQSGSEYGDMINDMIKEGKIVPSEVTVRLLLKAMEDSKGDKFLIDGFPRTDENRAVFERMAGIVPEFILFFDCPEDEMERRVLGRNQGRSDDNKETMQKRLKVFVDYSVPVVKYYENMGKVHKVTATGSIDDIHTTIEPLFERFADAHNTAQTQCVKKHLGESPANN